MKKYLLDIPFGLLVIILMLAAQFLVTIPFTEVAEDTNPERWQQLINRELLLAALPMLLITFFLAKSRHTQNISEGAVRGGIWALCILAFYVFIGNNNGSLELIFASIGLYALTVCALAGPVLPGYLAQRKKAA